jgi:hypothetical protein
MISEDYDPYYAHSPDRFVTVFEDVDGKGTEWAQVGNSLGETYVIDHSENETETARRWGKAVAISSDGSMFVVSAPGMSYYNLRYQQKPWTYFLGMVQAFQLAANGTTWIPLGQTLFGEYKDDQLGEKMALARNGQRLILSSTLYSEHTWFYVYDMVDGQWEKSRYGGNDELSTSHTSRDSDVVAISQDGLLVAISAADDSPSAYSDNPYQGKLRLFKWSDRKKRFYFIDYIQGEESFQHFGISMAFADDDQYTIVVGSKNSRDARFPDGDRIDVFRMNSTEKWERASPSFGWHVTDDGWNAVDISADGKRVVAGAKGANSRTGTVRVFDFAEQ